MSFDMWIGLRKVWRANGLVLQWIDNEDVTFTNWNTGQPNGADKVGDIRLMLFSQPPESCNS